MTPEQWWRIEALYHAARELAGPDRHAFLSGACARDEALRREVESLLAQPASAEGVLDGPAAAVAAQMVSDIGASLLTGRRLGTYHVQERLGAGGMGEVYRARDTQLGRDVAIKILPRAFMSDPERLARFEREARMLAALNHPHIGAIYGLEDVDGVPALVLELVEGETLAERLVHRPVAIAEALRVAQQIADALNAAHGKGIVHRDLKPANIKITPAGVVKVLDFGLAKVLAGNAAAAVMQTRTTGGGSREGAMLGTAADVSPEQARGVTVNTTATREGMIVGTPAYMSPEQVRGQPVDEQTDIWSFGCVLYELLTGRPAFGGETVSDTLGQILERKPDSVRQLRRDVGPDIERVVARCLEKDAHARYRSVSELLDDLGGYQARAAARRVPLSTALGRPSVAIVSALIIAMLAGTGVWWAVQSSRVRWARQTALPEIARLAEREDFDAAFRLLKEAEEFIPGEPAIREWRERTTVVGSIRTEPEGAEVYVKDYRSRDRSWFFLGRTPLESDVPLEYLRWRIAKTGFEPLEWASVLQPGMYGAERYRGERTRREPRYLNEPMSPRTPGTIVLTPIAVVPAKMIRVPSGDYTLGAGSPVHLDDYWLDRNEVTNGDFKHFVDAGAYSNSSYWVHPIVDGSGGGAHGTKQFRDKTGRPGPATWVLSTFPEGQADLPVSGVSWHEAAAYCRFAGKSLPTIYHWYGASGRGSALHQIWSPILGFSNFDGTAPARGGQFAGMAPYGTYDMAGNVKEWVWNAANEEQRYILGGAWNEPSYMFERLDAAVPLSRLDIYGFRCAKFSRPYANNDALLASVLISPSRDYTKVHPVSDREFDLYKSHYVYDRTNLNASVELVDDVPRDWRQERVSIDAAYRHERLAAHLFLPKNASPPYQTVIYFPAGGAFQPDAALQVRSLDFIMQSGRAAVYPVFQNTHERYRGPISGAAAVRELRLDWFKDLARTLDYLDTRPDIDHDRIAMYGFSTTVLPIFHALEPRLKTGIAIGGSLDVGTPRPEVDPFHFAPRVTVPFLMLNGRHDAIFPVETRQAPLLRLLSTPSEDKRHLTFESHHVPARFEMITEILDWLDRYLGGVKTVRAGNTTRR